MIQLQLISKILETKDYSIITENMLDESYFLGYEEEFKYIKDHYTNYGNIPDKATFLDKFKDIELVDVTESDRYLVDKAREEQLFNKSANVVKRLRDLLVDDANVAVEYLLSQIPNLQPNYSINGVDIIKEANIRYEHYTEGKDFGDEWFFTTGFKELDDIIHGVQRQEELFVIFARTNQG
ncbi:MAG: hypothetical protein HUJ56_06010, partial [Erysipelotrichaceae bacterium]|nr:hypothetical protein [Erysipelotrichaceae bacterium]